MKLIDGKALTISDVVQVARGGASVDIDDAAKERIKESWHFLRDLVAEGRPIYGLTTGFGALDGRAISPELNRQQQRCLLKSHAAGMGPPMADDEVRAMMVIRLNVLASGLMGIAPDAMQCLTDMLNKGVISHVPSRGSVGACGDLAPQSHMALPMIGLGRAKLGDGAWLPGAEVMDKAGISLPDMEGRDGIAMINGTEQTTGIGCLAAHDASRLADLAEEVAAMSLEALGAVSDSFDEKTALWKGHPGQIATSERMRALTADSESVLPPRPSRLRDGLSVRCIPQVNGAFRDAVARALDVMEIEINAANDNPLFGATEGYVTSNSGNFHGQHAAEAMDQLCTSLISVAVISERRSARLVDENHNGGLPAFLIHPDGVQGRDHGFMLAQYTAAALIAEMRMMSVPASIQSVPTCANTEDHVPMAPLASQRARDLCGRALEVIAVEALLAAQAMDIRGQKPAPALKPLYETIRSAAPMMVEDRPMGDDLEAAREALSNYLSVAS